MTGIVMAFFLGSLLAAVTQSALWLPAVGLCSMVAFRCFARWLGPCLALMAGFLWFALHAHAYASKRVSGGTPGGDVVLSGTVLGLPDLDPLRLRFDLRVTHCSGCAWQASGAQLRLSWPDAPVAPVAGEQWTLLARLKTPRGLANPGLPDFEQFAFASGIHGTGYVRAGVRDRRHGPVVNIDRWRDRIGLRLHGNASSDSAGAIMAALAVADRRHLSDHARDVFAATGTSHLLAISGLHIGLLAAAGALLGRLFYRLLCGHIAALTRPDTMAISALVFAGAYSAMAGFSLPTQRAMVMLIGFLVGTLCRRRLHSSQSLALALAAVLCIDPAAPLSARFWLSFGAVAALLLAGPKRGLRDWPAAQWTVFLALSPLLLGWGMAPSVTGVVINLLAIPWVTVVVLPPLLLGTLFDTLGLASGIWLLNLAEMGASLLWSGLESAATIPSRLSLALDGAAAGIAFLGVLLCLLPGALGVRPAGVLALALVGVSATASNWAWTWSDRFSRTPDQGVQIHVIDVGQGLAVLLRDGPFTLLYDTGPRGRTGWTAAESVILPSLERLGISRLDMLILSHGDADHAGGSSTVRRNIRVDVTLASEPGMAAVACVAGQQWQWTNATYRVLHPTPGLPYLGNDSSCVVEVRSGLASFLLSGDISEVVEGRLARDLGSIDGMTAPHHGSRTSSSAALLGRLAGGLVITSTGWENRFRMPHPEVLERYRQWGLQWLDTSACGQITLQLHPWRGLTVKTLARQNRRQRWRMPAPCRIPPKTIHEKTSMIRGFRILGE